MILLVVLVELDVDLLVEPDVHEMDRRATFPNHLQVLPVGGVVKAPQVPVINTEPVCPDVQDALLCRLFASRSRNGAATGVGDHTALDTVAAERLACAAKTGSRGAGGFFLALPGTSVEGQR
jgi:hypothetical protein